MKKHFQKIITVTMIAVMCLCLSVPAFATDISATSSLEVNYHSTNFWDWLVSLKKDDSKTSATDEQTNYTNSFGGSGTGRKIDSYSSTSGYKIILDNIGWWYEVTGSTGSVAGLSNKMQCTVTQTVGAAVGALTPFAHIDFTVDRSFTGKLNFPAVTSSVSGSTLAGHYYIKLLSSVDDGVSYQALYSKEIYPLSSTVVSDSVSLYPNIKYRLTLITPTVALL